MRFFFTIGERLHAHQISIRNRFRAKRVTTPFLTQLIGRNNLFFILYGAQVIE